MKIVHLFPHGVFFKPYYDCIKKIQGIENDFFVYGQSNNEIDKNLEDVFCGLSEDIFLEHYKEADLFIIQCLPELRNVAEITFKALESRTVRTVVVPWGRDIYNTSDIYRFGSRADIEIVDKTKVKIFEVASIIITSDIAYQYIMENYNCCAKSIYFNCLNTLEDIVTPKYELEESNNRVNVMVGHRGVYTGRHKEVFDELVKHIDKIDHVICPLSYGNTDYIKELCKIGADYFGSKWIPILSWMEKESYYEFLNNNVDIVIYNNSTFEGKNNLLFLAYMGKKIYISPENENYNFFVENCGAVEKWESVIGEDFMIPLSSSEIEQNRQLVKRLYDNSKGEWERIIWNRL